MYASVYIRMSCDTPSPLCTDVCGVIPLPLVYRCMSCDTPPLCVVFQLFDEFPELTSSQPAKKTIKSYNKLARVFVEYEMVYHQAWSSEVGGVVWVCRCGEGGVVWVCRCGEGSVV